VTLRWTSVARAKKVILRRYAITKRRKAATATDLNQGAPDWTGHIGLTNRFEPSCGCRKCTAARLDMVLKGV
jgi:hypothetical protein